MQDDTPNAKSLMHGLGEVVTPPKAPYSRLRVSGKTLAYCTPRKDGVLLDFPSKTLHGVPAGLSKNLTAISSTRTTLHVTKKNAKTARSLLEWVAKQIG